MDKWGWIILGAAVAVLAYAVYDTSGDDFNSVEPQLIGLAAQIDAAPFTPNNCIPTQGLVFARHSYPSVTGGNISSLIHHGWDAMRKSAPQDRMWFEAPPAEVQWLWQNHLTSADITTAQPGSP